MAGRRVYGGSEKSVLLRNDGLSSENFEALLSSSSSHGVFKGSRAMLNFEKVCGNTIKESLDDDLDDCFHQLEKKRRLTANQVQILEKSFEVENNLKPERKIQLAKELGLQPRQIAIWFQNRRARWKTKQLEKDYESLKSSYDVLKADYENLHKEKDELKAEVVHLTDNFLLKRKHEGFTEALELNKPDYNSTIEAKEFDNRQVGIKQEDHSSTNSAVSDSESPRYIDGTRTDSNAYQSDISHVDDEEVKRYHPFLKLEDNSGDFDFAVEDHAFWLWP